MTDQPRQRIAIDAPDEPTILAARHLDPTEGRVQVGTTVDTATQAAITRVLDYIAKAHNSPAAPTVGQQQEQATPCTCGCAARDHVPWCHGCGAKRGYEPDDTDTTETDIDRAMANAQAFVTEPDDDPHGLKAGMAVKPYTEHGARKWVFRCWGTDTCDGWLSLDHHSETSATRARDRHIVEEHTGEPS